ncbi:MAG: hypothetical protein LBN95_06095 [Prevotellaceae bacterium]|jgi:hypothetical protein|nr:hypothetical protein [Prevotellaceae bacterium]
MSKIKNLENFFLSEEEKKNLKGGVITVLRRNCDSNSICTVGTDPIPNPTPQPTPKCSCASCTAMSPTSVASQALNYAYA